MKILCEKLNLAIKEMHYSAELMTIKAGEEKWRFAIEKLLRPLALKLLVPEQHFMDANQVLRSHNIGMKIIVLSVNLEQLKEKGRGLSPKDEGFIISKLEFLPKAKQSTWLQI